MKQLWVLLLLGCVVTVHGEARKDERSDHCTQGLAALKVFAEHRGCDPDPSEVLEDQMISIDDNVTVSNFTHLFSNYCREVWPNQVQCFESNIRMCSRSQRNSLMRVARQTGFVCQPNSDRINPAIKHILRRLTDADLAENDACNKEALIQVSQFCYNRSLEVIDVSGDNFSNPLRNLSMVQLVPRIQRRYRQWMNCLVNLIHSNLRNCPQWRGKAVKALTVYVLPTMLGNSMTLTIAEINRVFRW